MLLGSTVVLQRRFDPHRVLAAVEEHGATALVVVPVMLEKLLTALQEKAYDTSSLRVIASSGSALPGDLAERVQACFGPVLYNLYGSTEVAYAAVATPEDLAADPRTAGRPPHGVTLRVVDEDGKDRSRPARPAASSSAAAWPSPATPTARTRTASTGWSAPATSACWTPTGGSPCSAATTTWSSSAARTSTPAQVEDVLAAHPSVAEVAVVDVEDPAYGVRLVAHVVPAPGAVVDEEELQELVRSRLARFAVPREVRLRDELPRNATGKVLRNDLRKDLRG